MVHDRDMPFERLTRTNATDLALDLGIPFIPPVSYALHSYLMSLY
ncbi:MAG: hypothetical protein AOA66_1612 [Candidatus Bathyarchaeota archaeon BA2]|nr:MAG: hypothetical protein AOA66_1612 [Candidatus Bathyarchaeota archaeon BA2]